MIEIFALYFIIRKMGLLAVQKGQPANKWKWYTFFSWVGAELLGIMVSFSLTNNLIMNAVSGLVCAFGGYLFVKYQLEQMPDKETITHWMDKIGKED